MGLTILNTAQRIRNPTQMRLEYGIQVQLRSEGSFKLAIVFWCFFSNNIKSSPSESHWNQNELTGTWHAGLCLANFAILVRWSSFTFKTHLPQSSLHSSSKLSKTFYISLNTYCLISNPYLSIKTCKINKTLYIERVSIMVHSEPLSKITVCVLTRVQIMKNLKYVWLSDNHLQFLKGKSSEKNPCQAHVIGIEQFFVFSLVSFLFLFVLFIYLFIYLFIHLTR